MPGRRKERKGSGIDYRVFVPALTASPAKKAPEVTIAIYTCREDGKVGRRNISQTLAVDLGR